MAVGSAFGAATICLDRLVERIDTRRIEIAALKPLVAAVRNAFSHGIAAPRWYVKSPRFERVDLYSLRGPQVDREALKVGSFDYSKIGGPTLWYRAKDYIVSAQHKRLNKKL